MLTEPKKNITVLSKQEIRTRVTFNLLLLYDLNATARRGFHGLLFDVLNLFAKAESRNLIRYHRSQPSKPCYETNLDPGGKEIGSRWIRILYIQNVLLYYNPFNHFDFCINCKKGTLSIF